MEAVIERFPDAMNIEKNGCVSSTWIEVTLGTAYLNYGDNPCCGGKPEFLVGGTEADILTLLELARKGELPITLSGDGKFECKEFNSYRQVASEYAVDSDRAYSHAEWIARHPTIFLASN